jgi:pimeloyl-ACP methyl ester carboxylesterase
MLHGWGASLYMHRRQLEVLPAAGFRTIAPDLRGHGRSEKPQTPGSYRRERFVTDCLSLMDQLGIERAAIVGQSLGGGVALRLALDHPHRVSALVLVNPVGLSRPLAPVAGLLVPRFLTRVLARWLPPRWLVGAILRHLVYAEPDRVSERDIDEYWSASTDSRYAPAMHATLREFDWQPVHFSELARLAVPALVLTGAADRILSGVDRAARAIPGVRVEVLRGGHAVNEESPGASYVRIRNFLEEHVPSG